MNMENKTGKPTKYEVMYEGTSKVPVKSWTRNVPFDENSRKQLLNMAQMPFIYKWVAAMPDVHLGKGATIGSVIPTIGAVIPAAVGVDLGCGMMAAKTSLTDSDLPDNLAAMRSVIENKIPHGRSKHLRRGGRDIGSWGNIPDDVLQAWSLLSEGFDLLVEKHPFLKNTNHLKHLGTLGTGNHFIEICLDENQAVWVMLHSGSRGVGNAISA